jgi:hypothetical protein
MMRRSNSRMFYQSLKAIALVLSLSIGIAAQPIFVEKIEVVSKYNATYLMNYSNVFLYRVRDLDRLKIKKLIAEFESSGLYKNVNWKLIKLDEESFLLRITPSYDRNFESIVVNDVILDGYPTVNKQEFLTKLADEGVPLGSFWYTHSFSEVVRKIRNAIDKSSTSRLFDNEIEVPWVSIRPQSPGKINLFVHAPEYDPEKQF